MNPADRNMDLNSSSPTYLHDTQDKLPNISIFSFSYLKKEVSGPATEIVVMIK